MEDRMDKLSRPSAMSGDRRLLKGELATALAGLAANGSTAALRKAAEDMTATLRAIDTALDEIWSSLERIDKADHARASLQEQRAKWVIEDERQRLGDDLAAVLTKLTKTTVN